jgi:hypothetical protein
MFKKIREHCRRKRIVLNCVIRRLYDFRDLWKNFGGTFFLYNAPNTASVAVISKFIICRVRVNDKIYNFFPFFGAEELVEALCFDKHNSLPPPNFFSNYDGLENFICERPAG